MAKKRKEKKKTGRPKKENALSGKERVRLWRERANNREKEKEKDRARKKDKKDQMTESELDELREKNTTYQARHKVKNIYSRQKKQCLKQKTKRKQAEYYEERKNKNPPKKKDCSTERVKAFRKRQKLVVKMPFVSKISTTTRTMSGCKRRQMANAAESLDALTPTKRVCFVKNVASSLSPGTRSQLVDHLLPGIEDEIDVNAVHTYSQIKKKRDKVSNAARKLIVKDMSTSTKKKLKIPWRLDKGAKRMDVEHILEVAKTKKVYETSMDVRKRVQAFYNQDTVSRVVPYKKATILVKDADGMKERRCIRVMEMSLSKAYIKYKEENKEDKLSQRKFETLRPKNVKTQKHARRMVCGCPQHANVDYMRNCAKRLMAINQVSSNTFDSNSNLVEYTMCESATMKCVNRLCSNCGVEALDTIKTQLKFCSEKCRKEGVDCESHTVKFLQYEKTEYKYKGEMKKKVALVDKELTTQDMVERLKVLLIKFPVHRFNVEHTKTQIDLLEMQLQEDEIIKIQDFSENYKCLLPDEIQSMHWVQQSAALFPAVVVRNVDAAIKEDHLLFLSNDLKHDVSFVEVVNDMIHAYYKEQGVIITRDFEFNDGCSSQFKSRTAIGLLSKRPVPTTRVWYESSHGKNASDGSGGHVKGALSYAVSASREVMRDAPEVYEYCTQNLSVENGTKRMLCRKFFFVTEEMLEAKRCIVKALSWGPIKDTLKIHQATTTSQIVNERMHVRNFACFCEACYEGRFSECDILTNPSNSSYHIFHTLKKEITYREHKFKKVKSKKMGDDGESVGTDIGDEALSDGDNEEDSEDEYDDSFVEFQVSSAVEMVASGSIVVVRASDNFSSYYLVRVIAPPFALEEDNDDDYRNTFTKYTTIITGNYLEAYGPRDDSKYYLDTSKTVFISTYCIAGISPELEIEAGKRKRKDIDVYCVSPDIHEALMELCLSSVV